MISLNAPSYDPIGILVIEGEPEDLYTARRRATVTATLDGGYSAYDTGYSTSDRVVRMNIRNARLEQVAVIDYLVQLYPRLIVSTRAGCFESLVEYNTQFNTVTLTIRFLEKLSS